MLYNLKLPSSIKRALNVTGGGNKNIIMLLGLGAVVGAGAWYLSNKGKEQESEKAMAAIQNYGLYPAPDIDLVASDSHPFGVQKLSPVMGARSFNDYTMNDNSIPTPFLEINFPYAPYTSNKSMLPPPLANTIDKNAYVVTYTGWRD